MLLVLMFWLLMFLLTPLPCNIYDICHFRSEIVKFLTLKRGVTAFIWNNITKLKFKRIGSREANNDKYIKK